MSKVSDYINNHLSIEEEYYRIFNKHLPQGKMFCPFHDNKNTPAAKKYGNAIHCFSCRRTYGVYDLLYKFDPQRIEDIKHSVVLEPSVEKLTRISIPKIDRNLSIDDILRIVAPIK